MEIKSKRDEMILVQWLKLSHLGTYLIRIVCCSKLPTTVQDSNILLYSTHNYVEIPNIP